MGVDAAIQVAQNGLLTALLVSAPILGLVLFVGLLISLVQAVTGLQEQTLSFVPKIAVVGGVLLLLGPWMLLQLVGFAAQLYAHMGVIVGQ
jgi:flagellar biosynthetic protein FliQ